MAKKIGIERFKELYAYFGQHKDKYFLENLLCDDEPIIAVSLLGPSGKPLKVVKISPVLHEQLCRYIFKGIEVSRPDLTIDENTIKAVVRILLLPPDIFKYPPKFV